MATPRHHIQPTSVELMERELYLKQIQINRLLDVTQAINNNLPAESLYKIYKDILNWEMSIQRLLLLVRDMEGLQEWETAAVLGINENAIRPELYELLPQFTRTINLSADAYPLLADFDLVIPVFHKRLPIAYAFIGGLDREANLYEKVKFVTTVTNIVAVAIENKRLFKRQLEQERLKREVELAAQVQAMLIPAHLPVNEHFEFNGVYLPHQGVGGDYYDVIALAPHDVIFCIADISGKGIAAALLMANFQANLQTLVRKRIDPARFIYKLNQTVLRITRGDKFITLFIGRYDARTRQLIYVNAGHNPPLLLHADGRSLLDKGCTILGIFDRIPPVEVGTIHVPANSLLVCYTDGLTELANPQQEVFGAERLHHLAVQYRHLPAAEFNQALLGRIHHYKGTEPFPDDVSVLTARFH